MQNRRTYVLRVWIEPDVEAEGRPALRATLQPAAGGAARPFRSLAQLAEAIRADLLGQADTKEEQP